MPLAIVFEPPRSSVMPRLMPPGRGELVVAGIRGLERLGEPTPPYPWFGKCRKTRARTKFSDLMREGEAKVEVVIPGDMPLARMLDMSPGCTHGRDFLLAGSVMALHSAMPTQNASICRRVEARGKYLVAPGSLSGLLKWYL